jgi:probable O-glycosylation ligase (exosortase A-associated)
VRDLVFTVIYAFTALPAMTRAWLGVLIWACLDYMNPHRLCYSFAKYTIPFSLITVMLTLVGILMSHERPRFAWSREVVILIVFIAWITFTGCFALNDEAVWREWDRAVKVQALIFVTLLVMRRPEHIHRLIWVIVVSIGIYGVKGGLWALMTGGMYRVRGPEYTFIEDNNDIALALVTIIPLMRYLQLRTEQKWVRLGLSVAMGLSALAAIASYSRAGMLALVAVCIFLVLKSRKKLVFGTCLLGGMIAIVQFMPAEWMDRMNTIKTYQTDNSALGRLNAWGFAWNLARARPITGGGFRCFTPKFFLQYAPDPNDYHEAHSVFLKILAEHGFPGLTLFLLLAACTWRSATWVRRHGRAMNLLWATDLASMIQVSLLGYGVGGAFSNLAYFGLSYHLMAIIVLCKAMIKDAAMTDNDIGADQESGEAIPAPAVA